MALQNRQAQEGSDPPIVDCEIHSTCRATRVLPFESFWKLWDDRMYRYGIPSVSKCLGLFALLKLYYENYQNTPCCSAYHS